MAQAARGDEAGETARVGRGFSPTRIAELLSRIGSAPEPEWLARGYVARGFVTVLAAKPKVGKSTLAASLVAAARLGGEWIGLAVRPCRALWLDLEMGELLAARFLAGAGCVDGDVWEWSGHRDGFNLPQLRAFVTQEGIELLVLDSWSKFAIVDSEINNTQLTREMNHLVRIARDMNVAIVLIHHQKKGEADQSVDDLRGGGAIAADADIILNLYPTRGTGRKLTGIGRFMDTTPAKLELVFRNGRYEREGAGVPTLTNSQQSALQALGEKALTFSKWAATSGLPEATFKKARKALVEASLVLETLPEGRYRLSTAGLALLPAGPAAA